MAEEVARYGRPVVFVIGANALQVPLVVKTLNAWGIEAYGDVGAKAFTTFAAIREDVTHVLVLHGETLVQKFRATLLDMHHHDLSSIDPVLELGEPECLRGIVIGAST